RFHIAHNSLAGTQRFGTIGLRILSNSLGSAHGLRAISLSVFDNTLRILHDTRGILPDRLSQPPGRLASRFRAAVHGTRGIARHRTAHAVHAHATTQGAIQRAVGATGHRSAEPSKAAAQATAES